MGELVMIEYEQLSEHQRALVRELRPYRRLISVQAVARREVFRPVEVPEPITP